MLESDPFVLSLSEVETTDVMRAEETIPQDWRYIEIPWQRAEIFDQIVEIAKPDLRILSCSEDGVKKRGEIVLGPDASSRINERAAEIRELFEQPSG
jgi:hypothetical protein